MELCTIETSDVEIDEDDSTDADDEPAAPIETEPPHEPAAPVCDDDLEIEDQALIAAARDARSTPSKRTRERAVWIAAFSLAIFVHAAGAKICLLLMAVFTAPHATFSQGSGSSVSGLVSEKSDQTESQESGVPGVMIPLPESQKTFAAVSHFAADSKSDSEASPEATFPVTNGEINSENAEPFVVGLVKDPIGPMPARHRLPAKEAVAPPAPITPSTPTGPTVAKPSVSAPPGSAMAAHHTFVAPRGAGHPGIGSAGSGFDSRGLPVPEYPPESERRKEEGVVIVEVHIRSDGTVAAARIAKASPYRRLNDCALEAGRTARFFPATIDRVPVDGVFSIPFVFSLR